MIEKWKCKTCKKIFERRAGGLITAIRRAKKFGLKIRLSKKPGCIFKIEKPVKMIACPSCGKDSLFEGVQKNATKTK